VERANVLRRLWDGKTDVLRVRDGLADESEQVRGE
jgi:hypothetical protein